MFEPEPSQRSCKHPLEELLRDPDFLKIIELLTKEIMRFWRVPSKLARGFVLSVINEPETLERISNTWSLAKQTGESLGLAKVIIRRCVIDLLRNDTRHPNHGSLPTAADAIEADRTLGSFDDLVQRPPRAQRALRQIIQRIPIRVVP